ncbi:MAG: reprolysin-like metallopeptidase [Chitinophagaceae bacterium]
MRLAQSCNGEYANYFGAETSAAQVALVLAAYNATLTRCNGCYEKDLAIHLNLIPTTNECYLL